MSNLLRDGNSRVMLFGVAALVLICGFVIVNSYRTQIEIYEDKELAKLSSIANTLSLQIDGDDHWQLTKQYPKKDAILSSDQDVHYQKIHKLLADAKEANELNVPLYTMVYKAGDMQFCLGVTSSEVPYWMHEYSRFPREIVENLEEGGTLEPYESENGHWLSAYAPIKNMAGETVALVQADTQFDSFLAIARGAAWKNILFSFVVIGALSALMLLFMRSIFRKQRKLEVARASVEAQRRELTANISHDLRTPLASIQGYLETILMKKESLGAEREKKYLSTALHNANKLKKMVDNLFELSRLESAEKKLQIEPFNVAELLFDIKSSLNIQAQEAGMELCVAKIPTEVPLVSGDLAQIDRVLQNLIGNAIEHGRKEQTIRLALEIGETKVRVLVQDDGPGISKERLSYVFDRFSTMKEQQGGSGLGLAIVKRVLEMHQSDYALKSIEGEGTTFWFELGVV